MQVFKGAQAKIFLSHKYADIVSFELLEKFDYKLEAWRALNLLQDFTYENGLVRGSLTRLYPVLHRPNWVYAFVREAKRQGFYTIHAPLWSSKVSCIRAEQMESLADFLEGTEFEYIYPIVWKCMQKNYFVGLDFDQRNFMQTKTGEILCPDPVYARPWKIYEEIDV